MKSTYYLFSTAAISLALMSLGQSAQAGFFYGKHLIDDPSHSFDDNPWIYFGGCENLEKTACDGKEPVTNSTILLIGDYNVKQGAYQITEPTEDHIHGKLLLTFYYQFLTEEDSSNTTDIGYVKLKDIETNEIYSLTTLMAQDKTDEWQHVRVGLPIELVNRPLQLVVEVVNDGERLSRMGIENIFLTHASEPVIRGTVYGPEVAGKPEPLEGVTIKLQNRSRTKTYTETITVVQSDTPDTYTFWPVPRRKRFTIVASYQGEEKTRNVRKLMWGSFKADEDFTFDS